MTHYRALHISDLHLRADGGSSVLNRGISTDPLIVIRDFLMNFNFDSIDFIALTGDLTNRFGQEQDYQLVKELLDNHVPSTIPVFTVLGNHDNKQAFWHVFGAGEPSTRERHYFVTHFKTLRIIGLDSSSPDIHSGSLDQAQAKWLLTQLEDRGPQLGTIILIHHPFEISWVPLLESFSLSSELQEALLRSDVRAILTGHLHMGRASSVYTKPQFTAPSLAVGIERVGKNFWDTTFLGYRLFEISPTTVDSTVQPVAAHRRVITVSDMSSDWQSIRALTQGLFS